MNLQLFIKAMPAELHSLPIWTVSVMNDAGQMKCVANIHQWIDDKPVRGHCDDSDYDTLENVIRLCNEHGYEITNLRMRGVKHRIVDTQYGVYGYVILDIEKDASEATRELFKDAPYVYSETSMSGKGQHMMIYMRHSPESMLNADIQSLKHSSKEYEVLIQQDVTFTGNDIRFQTIPEAARAAGSNTFYDIYNDLTKGHRSRRSRASINDWENDEPSSDVYKDIVDCLVHTDKINDLNTLVSILWDRHNDKSKALWTIGHMLYKTVIRPEITANIACGETITIDDASWILFRVLEETVKPLRNDFKYDEKRHRVPILLDEARRMTEDCEAITEG